MDIIKTKTEIGTYDFSLVEDNKVMQIVFGGNGDLYWIINSIGKQSNKFEKNIKYLQSTYEETFVITKENYFIYSLFKQLMEDISNSRIYEPHDYTAPEESLSFDDEELFEKDQESKEEKYNKLNECFRNSYRHKLLYNDGTITWHSDEYEYDISPRVKIYYNGENIEIKFLRPPVKEEYHIYHSPKMISIRFRNSGSTYDPFNVIFMRLFQKLQEYEPDYHQIHIEELEYQKKLKRVKTKPTVE